MNLDDGHEEGHHKYSMRKQFFSNELAKTSGQITLSFKNQSINNKKYLNPQAALAANVTEIEIIHALLTCLDVERIYQNLKSTSDKNNKILGFV